MPNWVSNIKSSQKLGDVIVIIFLLAWVGFRLYSYGDPALSIAGNDTITFIEGSQVPLFSAEMMTGRRLLTTNLIYKIFEPEGGYQILVNGSAETTRRVVQPGFEGIVVLQFIFSILGWCGLTWVVASKIKSLPVKIAAALIIPAFGFSPQIADWDSILMSEALTFSLFVLQLALLIHIVFSLHKDPTAKVNFWIILWGVVYFFWANVRDTNNYAALVLMGLTGLTLLFRKYKNKQLIGIVVFSVILFILGVTTFNASGRSLISTINIYTSEIFPYPTRVEYMQEQLGMPEPNTAEFFAWFEESGVPGITRFFAAHPGYVVDKLYRDFPDAFRQSVQVYFTVPDKKIFREFVITVSESLHTEATTPFTLGLMLLIGILLVAVNKTSEDAYPWAWVGTFVFMVATIAIIPTILGDTWALHRHTIFSIAMYRLSMWFFALILMDLALNNKPDVIAQE